MAVDVERYRSGGVPEEFLNVLGMNTLAKEQSGAGVPEVVKAFGWQFTSLQEPRERPLPEIRGVDQSADL